jgi:hypothetical protein
VTYPMETRENVRLEGSCRKNRPVVVEDGLVTRDIKNMNREAHRLQNSIHIKRRDG